MSKADTSVQVVVAGYMKLMLIKTQVKVVVEVGFELGNSFNFAPKLFVTVRTFLGVFDTFPIYQGRTIVQLHNCPRVTSVPGDNYPGRTTVQVGQPSTIWGA